MRRTGMALALAAGFTLVEVLIAVALASVLLMSVLQVFQVSLYAREEIKALAEPMTLGPRILDMIERDVQNVWTYNIKDNRVFKAIDDDIVGDEADKLHLVVAGRTMGGVLLKDDSYRSAPFAEVSYVVRANPENGKFLELWRREDPLLDEEPTKGGTYELLADRVRAFNLVYFSELGRDAEEDQDWDAAERGELPRRVRIELTLERHGDTFNVLSGVEVEDLEGRLLEFKREVVLDSAKAHGFDAGVALVPVVPPRHPEFEQAGGGGGGGGAAKRSTTTKVGGGAAKPRARQPAVPGMPLPIPGAGRSGDINDLLRRLPRAGGRGGGGGGRGSGGGSGGGGRGGG